MHRKSIFKSTLFALSTCQREHNHESKCDSQEGSGSDIYMMRVCKKISSMNSQCWLKPLTSPHYRGPGGPGVLWMAEPGMPG